MAWPLAAQAASGELPQLIVDVRQETIERLLAAPSPLDQEIGELSP
jgi:hypothetical protein